MDAKIQGQSTAQPPQQEIDPVKLKYMTEKLRSEQNLLLGIVGGGVSALVGAGIWAAVTFWTGYQIGWMAVGVGCLVGFAMQFLGKGIDSIFGMAGSILALVGCALGNLMAVCAFLSHQRSVPFFEILLRLDLDTAVGLMTATFQPMDLLFYGIAVYEGYKFSFRQLSEQEMSALLGQ